VSEVIADMRSGSSIPQSAMWAMTYQPTTGAVTLFDSAQN